MTTGSGLLGDTGFRCPGCGGPAPCYDHAFGREHGSAVVTPGIGADALALPVRDEATARHDYNLTGLRKAYAKEQDDRIKASPAWAIAELGGVE